MAVLKSLPMLSALVLSITACAHKPEVLPTPRLVYTCPEIRSYSKDSLTELYKEINVYGKQVPVLIDVASEGLGLRDAARACKRDQVTALTNHN